MPVVLRDRDVNEFRRQAPEILDAESAARFLGVSERVLIENVEKLAIPCRTIGRTMIFSRAALVRWVENLS